jgi:hypothetical protein
MTWKTFGWGTALAVLAIACGVFGFRSQTVAQQPTAAAAAQTAAGPKYTIVDTDGTNLLVVDNATNTVYFYTVDPGKEVGDDLHLRGSLDLGDVGKPVLKPKKAK